ncbi:hypothetical protein [Caudovirales GX15bay]|nr:hypothetical protein [Caudovirales GX15bay]
MITYETGDATDPPLSEPFIIAHVLSTAGVYGRGFAAAVAHRYPTAKARYVAWATPYRLDGSVPLGSDLPYGIPFELGSIQWVAVGRDLLGHHPWFGRWVVNMVAMEGLRSSRNPRPLNLDALEQCLCRLSSGTLGRPVAMPRIGCGLAGGAWEVVEPILNRTLSGVDVHVYDPPDG